MEVAMETPATLKEALQNRLDDIKAQHWAVLRRMYVRLDGVGNDYARFEDEQGRKVLLHFTQMHCVQWLGNDEFPLHPGP
jgi:predicted metal-dependent enzyme (double-stranded beta helix superfamily)